MSHLNKAKLEMINRQAGERAIMILAEKAGVKATIDYNTKQCRYYARQTAACDGVIRIEGHQYDLGITIGANGQMGFIYDAYSGEVENVFGRNLMDLENRYIVENARDEAQFLNDREIMEGRDPFNIVEGMTEDGNIYIELQRGN